MNSNIWNVVLQLNRKLAEVSFGLWLQRKTIEFNPSVDRWRNYTGNEKWVSMRIPSMQMRKSDKPVPRGAPL
ncbi:hypothetical protein G7047_23085 [Diaphorobacter sp. HDW4A]|uniref:hypothetical protein n=1 Tax=Diaphorobacter sp. HDW4A TaxID=2714924 RepID=UPI00140976E3|nr:hypothetical protein [Diaphorobacter sp. HDW4A]QIL82496.1 hypothetical protein G7047_23085 [Diaphorobacter sp. HDW4A]